MNSGLVVDVDQSRSSDLPTVCHLPKIEAPHVWKISAGQSVPRTVIDPVRHSK